MKLRSMLGSAVVAVVLGACGMEDTGKDSDLAYLKAADAGNGKVAVCHIPPGNPANAHTIVVGAPAVKAHLAHGDVLGTCEDGGLADGGPGTGPGCNHDAGTAPVDAGTEPVDAGTPPVDAGTDPVDAGSDIDAGSPDAGVIIG
jgi:hypothetical protein